MSPGDPHAVLSLSEIVPTPPFSNVQDQTINARHRKKMPYRLSPAEAPSCLFPVRSEVFTNLAHVVDIMPGHHFHEPADAFPSSFRMHPEILP